MQPNGTYIFAKKFFVSGVVATQVGKGRRERERKLHFVTWWKMQSTTSFNIATTLLSTLLSLFNISKMNKTEKTNFSSRILL